MPMSTRVHGIAVVAYVEDGQFIVRGEKHFQLECAVTSNERGNHSKVTCLNEVMEDVHSAIHAIYGDDGPFYSPIFDGLQCNLPK